MIETRARRVEDHFKLVEPETVIRTNLRSGFTMHVQMSEAVAQIAAMSSAEEFGSRLEIVAALCDGRLIEAGSYSYRIQQ